MLTEVFEIAKLSDPSLCFPAVKQFCVIISAKVLHDYAPVATRLRAGANATATGDSDKKASYLFSVFR